MMLVILCSLLFLASIGFSILGQGGGALYTPIQVFLGIDFHTAATTSLFLIMTVSFSSTLVFRKAGRIDWPLAILLEIITALGGFTGGLSSGHFSSAFLAIVLAGFISVAAFFMIMNYEKKALGHGDGPRLLVWHRNWNGFNYGVNLAIALPVSFLAGLVSGMVGIGGGIIKVPMMVLLLGIPMEIAIGSSAFMIGITAASGFTGHVLAGHWDWRTSLIGAAAVFIGAQIGSRWSIGMDKTIIKKGFGWFLLAIALMMIVKAFF